MTRTLQSALSWAELGAKLVHEALATLDEAAFEAPSLLPGWTRKHLAAHLAANADAVANLVHWAATGERTPMYSSAEQRLADIESGSTRSGGELRDWFDDSAGRLAAAMADLTPDQWAAEVVTAQGRTVPASETPWIRAREVMVHAVDLGVDLTFQDLPADFLRALGDDIFAKRGGGADTPALVLEPSDDDARWVVPTTEEPTTVVGSLADIVAYLAGRDGAVTTEAGASAPPLPAWL